MSELMPLFKVHMAKSAIKAATKVLKSGYITEGPKVKEFEYALEEYLRTPVITLNSGTSALWMALKLANVKPGDEIITTPMTCQATNTPILTHGAIPVWADVNPRTGLIDPVSVASKITTKTRAVMAVDWGGATCDYDALGNVLLGTGIKIIEDAAHALGSGYKGTITGKLADFTCFSFQAIKHVTSVDGGALTAHNREDLTRGRLLRWYGIDRELPLTEFRGEQDVLEAGMKLHMNDVNAAIGLENLKYVMKIVLRHRWNAEVLDLNLDRDIYTSTDPEYEHYSSHWLYTVLLPDHDTRERFKAHMKGRNIQVSQVHWRNDKLTAFKQFVASLPGVDEFASRMVCVPVHYDADSLRVLDAMNGFVV